MYGFVCLKELPSESEAAELQNNSMGHSYIAEYERKWKSKFKRSKGRAKQLKRHVPGRRIVDIGSNVGLFVHAANTIGLDCMGVEINQTLVEYAQKRFPEYQFVNSSLEQLAINEHFDGIYCSEVIEHVPDVRHFAQCLFSLLNDGGVLYLTTPNLDEFQSGAKINRDLLAPDHKLYFNKSNIKDFLISVGFRKVQFRFALGGGIKLFATK